MSSTKSYSNLEYKHKDLTLVLKSDDVNGQQCSSKSTNESSSSFDFLLTSLWEDAMSKDLFRYKLTKNCLQFKALPGRFNYIAQLNPDRAQKRRQPQEIQSVNQPFNPNEFHFNKVSQKEILLSIEPPWDSLSSTESKPEEHFVLINVSPLEYCHVLLTPFRNQCRPQNLTVEGLRLSLESCLLSNSSDYRVGFNSLCGYASVNHEHYHAYYLSHRLYVEHAPLVKVLPEMSPSPWLQFEDVNYPPGFSLILADLNEMDSLLTSLMALARYFQENNIGHNLYITRGSTKNVKGHFDCLRIFIWARKSSFGAKACDAFNPALCELAGHFPIKSENAYDDLSEEFILRELHDICDEPFTKTKDWLTSNVS